MSLDGAVPDETHHRDHGFEGVRNDMTGGMRFHTVAIGRKIGRTRIVYTNRFF